MTSPYWQAVLAGASKAGQDLGVNVVDLGAQSENDVSGQISILETAVTSNPAAIVIAPTQYAALGKPIDEAAKKVKIIGLESSADTKAMTSLLANDNVNAGRIAADALAAAITKSFADTEGDIAVITAMPGVASWLRTRSIQSKTLAIMQRSEIISRTRSRSIVSNGRLPRLSAQNESFKGALRVRFERGLRRSV